VVPDNARPQFKDKKTRIGTELSRNGILNFVNFISVRFNDPGSSPIPYRIILTNKQTK
jgi:hypothetical protein